VFPQGNPVSAKYLFPKETRAALILILSSNKEEGYNIRTPMKGNENKYLQK
jgi:hypothetical protein